MSLVNQDAHCLKSSVYEWMSGAESGADGRHVSPESPNRHVRELFQQLLSSIRRIV